MAWFFRKRNERSFSENNNKNSLNKNNFSKFVVKAISLIRGSDSRDKLTYPEYNLEEIRQACEADSYIKMALMKYSYMLFKAGYTLKSENEKATEYIKSRLYIMGFSTNKPIDILFQEVGDDLIKYSNAFLVKTRVTQIMPGIQAKGFYKQNPVGGYFRIDPSTISIERDKNGTIKKYIQTIDGEEKTFDATEVIHFYLDKEAANAFGTPRIIAAMEDVKLLRRLEGNVISMIYRFAMPLFQWIIGLPQAGFQATDKEIQQAQNEINNMPLDGSVVTNEKTNIKVIGAEGSAINAEGYLKYFEQRVFSALGVSEAQMGRGGAKQDADSMESQAHDTVKHIQKVFSIFVENFIINELLLEGGFNPVINEKDRVFFVFNEINIDTKIKLENHNMAMYQSNMLSFDEMRRELGRRSDIEEEKLYKNMIETKAEKDIIKSQADEEIRIAKANAKLNNDSDSTDSNNDNSSSTKGMNVKGNGTIKSQAPNKDISNKNTPENQHGKTSVKVKESLDNNIENSKKRFFNIYKKYNNLRNDIKEASTDPELVIPLSYQDLLASIKIELQKYSIKGMEQAKIDISKLEKKNVLLPHVSVSIIQFEEMAEESLKKTLSIIEEKVKDNRESSYVDSVFQTLEYRIRFLLEYVLPKTYWYSYLKTGESLGYKKAKIDFGDSKDKEQHPHTIDLNSLNIDEIPPYHPFCDCKIVFKKGDKK